ncbi:DUF397 domain-containing protein [Salinactinospora qingdaonensis]|uniref:DUF397 domain-containing protein n=1 Tax=Salinactinospora qingdaonensis TaxID=702744 RepID=UPI0031EED38B
MEPGTAPLLLEHYGGAPKTGTRSWSSPALLGNVAGGSGNGGASCRSGSGNRVEVAQTPGRALVRDAQHREDGHLAFAFGAWAMFLRLARTGSSTCCFSNGRWWAGVVGMFLCRSYLDRCTISAAWGGTGAVLCVGGRRGGEWRSRGGGLARFVAPSAVWGGAFRRRAGRSGMRGASLGRAMSGVLPFVSS